MKWVFLAVALGTGASAFSLRPAVAGSLWMWLGLAIPYGALSAIAVYKMHRDGVLRTRLVPKSGDIALGLVTGAVLVLGAWATTAVIAPAGSEKIAWVYRVLLLMGGPDAIRASVLLTAATLAIAGFEELTWRGLVLSSLEEKIGTRRAWYVSAWLYAGAMLPTVYSLRDPNAGLNPMLVLAALGVGLVWGLLVSKTGRLVPAILSHMVFTYFAPSALAG